MSNIRKFEFNKSYEEVEVAGESYKIEFNDAKLLEYTEAFKNYEKETNRINKVNGEELNQVDQKKMLDEIKEQTQIVIELLLGEGSFAKLYSASGESMFNMLELAGFISEVVNNKATSSQQDAKDKYINKKKK